MIGFSVQGRVRIKIRIRVRVMLSISGATVAGANVVHSHNYAIVNLQPNRCKI